MLSIRLPASCAVRREPTGKHICKFAFSGGINNSASQIRRNRADATRACRVLEGPNRMSTAGKQDGASKVIVSGTAITMPHKGDVHLKLPLPLPCITILVHGVNDVGEAYEAQEIGLCTGLNARLDRAHGPGTHGVGDLVPAKYAMPPSTPEDRRKEGIKADPDAVYFRRTADRNSWSPVIPFYWGSSESAGIDPHTGQPYIKKDNWHGQWTDRYGNRLDKNGSKNGGPFVNATNNLNAMWGDGFNGEVANSTYIAESQSNPLHNLKKACPRLYMVLAAKRLAMLIKIIRNNESYKNVAINLLCHSQGSMVALAAHAMLAAEGSKYSADTLIVQDPPYSFEETSAEYFDGMTGKKQQTTQSRIKTLSNIVHYINEKKSSVPPLAELEFPSKMGQGVAGPNWKSGTGARQWVNGEKHTFRERDNRGKVYLYFCPLDETVALMNVQGIGWQGVPDRIRAPDTLKPPTVNLSAMRGPPPRSDISLAVLSALGEGFRQRIFTSREVNNQPLLVGAPPGPYEMRSASGVWPFTEENSTTGNRAAATKQIERGAIRQITGEELHPQVRAVLTIGEAGHAGMLAVSPIDAKIAIASGKMAFRTNTCVIPDFRVGARHGASPLTADEIRQFEDRLPGQKRGIDVSDVENRLKLLNVDGVDQRTGRLWGTYTTETPNEACARWQNDETDKNSHHSAIPGNPAHAAGVTAYDLSLGAPLPNTEEDKVFMNYLRAVADWRTDWKGMTLSTKPINKQILERYSSEKTPKAIDLIEANSTYYTTGELPADVAVDDIANTRLIARQTVADRARGKSLD